MLTGRTEVTGNAKVSRDMVVSAFDGMHDRTRRDDVNGVATTADTLRRCRP